MKKLVLFLALGLFQASLCQLLGGRAGAGGSGSASANAGAEAKGELQGNTGLGLSINGLLPTIGLNTGASSNARPSAQAEGGVNAQAGGGANVQAGGGLAAGGSTGAYRPYPSMYRPSVQAQGQAEAQANMGQGAKGEIETYWPYYSPSASADLNAGLQLGSGSNSYNSQPVAYRPPPQTQYQANGGQYGGYRPQQAAYAQGQGQANLGLQSGGSGGYSGTQQSYMRPPGQQTYGGQAQVNAALTGSGSGGQQAVYRPTTQHNGQTSAGAGLSATVNPSLQAQASGGLLAGLGVGGSANGLLGLGIGLRR